jgi:hypothetical protein
MSDVENRVMGKLDALFATATEIKAQRDEAQLQLGILIDFLAPKGTEYCRCENNGDYCDFCEMLAQAKEAMKGAQ